MLFHAWTITSVKSRRYTKLHFTHTFGLLRRRKKTDLPEADAELVRTWTALFWASSHTCKTNCCSIATLGDGPSRGRHNTLLMNLYITQKQNRVAISPYSSRNLTSQPNNRKATKINKTTRQADPPGPLDRATRH